MDMIKKDILDEDSDHAHRGGEGGGRNTSKV